MTVSNPAERLQEIEKRRLEIESALEAAHSTGVQVLKGSRAILPIIDEKLIRLQSVQILRSEISDISEPVMDLAEKIKSLVRAKRNVGLVARLLEFGAAFRPKLDSLSNAVAAADWTTAASCVADFREMEAVGAFSLIDESLILAQRNFQVSAAKAVHKEFETAIRSGDAIQVGHLAKLFTALGIGEEAVDRYVGFVRSAVADKCRAIVEQGCTAAAASKHAEFSPVVEKLFLAIADVVQDHQRHVEEQFGNFSRFFKALEEEANIHASKILRLVTEGLRDNRTKLERPGTPEKRGKLMDTDMILEDAVLVIQRSNQFRLYVKHQIPSHQSQVSEVLQEATSQYVELERGFFVASITQALNEDTAEETGPSSLPDEVFFVALKCLQRSVSSLDINAACAVANHTISALQSEYKNAIEAALNDSKRDFANFASTPKLVHAALGLQENCLAGLLEGKTRPTSADSFPHALSNVFQSLEDISGLKTEILAASESVFSEHHELFVNCISGLDGLRLEFEEIHVNAARLAIHYFKPAFLTPALTGLDRLNSFNLTESAYADFQVNDPFAKSFIAAAGVTLNFLKRVLPDETVEIAQGILIDQLCAKLERVIFSMAFSALGALQLDQDVRRIAGFFSSVGPVKQKFARLTDICTVLNFESVEEFAAFYRSRAVSSRLKLSMEEIKGVLSLRVELDPADIEAALS